jgi:hypothetical protein
MQVLGTLGMGVGDGDQCAAIRAATSPRQNPIIVQKKLHEASSSPAYMDMLTCTPRPVTAESLLEPKATSILLLEGPKGLAGAVK